MVKRSDGEALISTPATTTYEKVSVIIPTYNRAHLLDRAVASVARQGYPNLEIIIVDDRSTDNTSGVVEKLRGQYPAVIYCLNHRRKGPSGARNTGILAATGDWLAFLDSDDKWLPDHISEALACFKMNPKATVIFGNFSVMDAESDKHVCDFFDQKIVLKNLRKKDLQNGFWLLRDNIFEALVRENFFHIGSSLVRREVAGGILFDEDIRLAEDRDFAIRLFKEACADFACRVSPTFIQYRHSGNLTEFSQTDVLMEDYHAHLHLFKKYIREYDLSGLERKTVWAGLRNTLVKLSYRCRQRNQWRDSWHYLLRSFNYGVSRRQIEECVKLFISTLAGHRNEG